MKLVIVESPSKCTTISKFLGSDYEVLASQGHIRDLSKHGKGGLGIDVDNGFKPDWEFNPKKSAIVTKLKNEAKKADEVILATDPDREGEAIAWHLADVLKLDKDTVTRLQFHEITKPAVTEALEHPGKINQNLVDSQETRRMYDRIIGFKLSSLLQKKIHAKSAGRVQSVTLRMIVDNDAERKAFVPEEYWSIQIELEIAGKKIKAALNKVDGKPVKITSKEEADKVLARLGETIDAIEIKKSKKTIPPKLPFTTSTMQQEAFNRFKFSTSKTQSLAQKLYEGLEIAGEHVGLITYMRTDSARISPVYYERHAKRFISETFGEEYLGKVQSAKKGALSQDAHEAIRPTAGLSRTPEKVKQYLTADEAKLYTLIFDRAMASLMAPKKTESTSVVFATNGLEFTLTGSRTLFPGYAAVYGQYDDDEEATLPEIEQGKAYRIVSKTGEQKFTQPPAAYTEAKVVKLMEEKGIGRPSTYAATLQTLQKAGYITSKGGVLSPTEKGIETTVALEKHFPEIIDYEYTANMEKKLDQVSSGECTRIEAMNGFYGDFINKFEKASSEMEKAPATETGELCPVCGSPLVIRKSNYGTFIGCSNFPTCTYKKIEPKEAPKETGELCPVCGKPLVIKTNRRGKSFIGCSGYPHCSYIKPEEGAAKKTYVKKKATYTEADYVKACPDCKNGHLVIKKSKKGTSFLGCTNFPKCRHVESLPENK